ncbi:fungal-specific transcription factor domain-containing protein [Leptodontidium sp. MPI-SDFR-AT-0119]|nr:fungal-specific transcription factor domain-containing protein [Leptodontidium sp. MPI-SDFR-AT-0119]
MPPPRIRTVEGSCWGCKERRVICDLTLPACSKCLKIGRRCDYGKVRLRWTDCVASRGRLAGKKIPLYQPTALIKTADHHMLYFSQEVLPRFTISNSVMHLDLAELSKDPVLLQSIVAVANAHATYRSANEKALSLSKIEDRNSALRLFRKHLMGAHTEEVNHSLFIANVLLCILDGIIEPITESSATHHHIIGGKAILKQWKGMGGILQTKYELPLLMLSIFATLDLTHALLIGDDPYFEASTWSEFGDCDPWWGNVRCDDDFLETMAIISQLATLGHEVRNFRSTVPIGVLLSIQMALEQQAARQLETKHTPDQAAWAAFCACYRFTASVYLYRALSVLDVNHELVQQAVESCMEIIGGDALTDKLHHCILFPVLIVGSHCLKKEQRVGIKKSLARTGLFLAFESLRSLESFLEKRWEQLDNGHDCMTASWWAYFDEIANVTCLF